MEDQQNNQPTPEVEQQPEQVPTPEEPSPEIPEEQVGTPTKAKHRSLGVAVGVAVLMALVLVLVGVLAYQNNGSDEAANVESLPTNGEVADETLPPTSDDIEQVITNFESDLSELESELDELDSEMLSDTTLELE